jgi:hypothetical protein
MYCLVLLKRGYVGTHKIQLEKWSKNFPAKNVSEVGRFQKSSKPKPFAKLRELEVSRLSRAGAHLPS